MTREQKEMLLRRVKREVYNYQDETSYPKRGKPIAPEKQKPAAAKLADYRVQDAKSLEQPEPAGDSPGFPCSSVVTFLLARIVDLPGRGRSIVQSLDNWRTS